MNGKAEPLARAEIDLGKARENLGRIGEKLGGSVRILAVVKADAYAHGAVELARVFSSSGADFLGVANCREGIELRDSGLELPVLVLNPPAPAEVDPMIENSLTPAVDSVETALMFSRALPAGRESFNVHAEVDTGMGRSGMPPGKAAGMIKKIMEAGNLRVEGVFTHFSRASEPGGEEFTGTQVRRFAALVSELESEGIRIPLKHASNSAGVMLFPEGNFNMVRPGLILYGISPVAGRKPPTGRILSLKTIITHVRKVPRGTPLGYGGRCRTARASVIATLPVGYADGYDRRLSAAAEVLIKGRRAPLAGTIYMDRCLADITGIDAAPGEEAVLIGKQGDETITVEELSERAGTIPHEFVSRLGKRIRRVYL